MRANSLVQSVFQTTSLAIAGGEISGMVCGGMRLAKSLESRLLRVS